VQEEFRDRTIDLLLRGRGARGAARRRLGAAIAVALDFRPWDTLTGAALPDDEAARVAAAMVAGALRA
jgi:hypothetical protein